MSTENEIVEETESQESSTQVEEHDAVASTPAGENEPVYAQFVKRLMGRAHELGITLEDKNGWQLLCGPNGHRICIQKSQTKLPVIETTLDPERCGGVAPSKPNGRIRARMPQTPEAVLAALPCLVDPNDPIAPPKRGKGQTASIPSLDELLATPAKEEEVASSATE